MDRIELGTPDLTEENIQKLGELFPQVLTEVQDEAGEVRQAVDFDALRDLLGDVAEGQRERYQFTWPGKREAKAEARRPIDKTLRPCLEESVDWDITENLYIEGDNLDALKILKETYAGKVKMIYIDPPYNTGHDFIYKDKFAKGQDEYAAESGEYSEEGGRLVANPESNGKFHSDWCSMMYPRLLLARDLLTDDGVIFISIDENELSNVIKIVDEIFLPSLRIGIFKWNKTSKAPTLSKLIRNKYEYVLAYRKEDRQILKGVDSYNSVAPLFNGGNKRSEITMPEGSIDCSFPDGVYNAGQYGDGDKCVFLHNDFVVEKGINRDPICITGRFKWSQETLNQRVSKGQRFLIKNPKFTTLYYYLDSEDKFIAPSDLLNKDECGVLRNDEAFGEMRNLFGFPLFEYTKPSSLIRYLIRMIPEDDITVMDFFSGSGTTAQAAFEMNREDGGSRNVILVQIPEASPEDSEAAKAGYKNICEIGKERIRRAGAKIKAEAEEANKQLKLGETPKKVPDIGFRVLKIESSSFKDTLATPDEINQQILFDLQDNVKGDRSDMDLLFEVLPKFRIPYSAKIEELSLCGKRCFNVEDGQLIACFDVNVGVDAIEAIAKMQPIYAVIRDASLADDATHANFEELFKTYSPETVRRVI